jgi:hypothetical protein
MMKLHALKGGASGGHTGQIRVIRAVINKKATAEPVVFPSVAIRSEREAINRICLSSRVNSLSLVLSNNCWSSILFSKTKRIFDISVEEFSTYPESESGAFLRLPAMVVLGRKKH